MANKLPAYIIKDCTILANGDNRIGQVSEITIPVLEKTTEEFRNGGMIKPRVVTMGLEAMTCMFKETAFDPGMIQLFGIGRDEKLIARGYMQSEDGTEHAARFEMRADVTKVDPGAWATAQKAEAEYEVTVHEGALFIDDVEVLRFDDFSWSVGGVDQMPGRRSALAI
jgi:P2 family phage contractile tail tube protein